MNKRFILIDDDPNLKVDIYRWFGTGQTLIYTMSQLTTMDEATFDDTLKLGPGDGAILVGPGAFKVISERYHIGIRGENYFDCSHLRRLGLDSGAFVKVYHELDKPDQPEIDFFGSPEFCKVRDFPDYTWRVIKTLEDALPWLEYYFSQENVKIGFDYETSGMPMEVDLWITGAALCARRSSTFFSFTEILKNSGPDKYQEFLDRFRSILAKQDRFLWVYNLQFEQQVTWRFFGLETELNDASAFNVLDGLHSKNYSLKWSIQRLLGGGDTCTPGLSDRTLWDHGGIKPWDTDFDRLEELLDSMYFEVAQIPGTKGKKNM